jgi:hypothetical protein
MTTTAPRLAPATHLPAGQRCVTHRIHALRDTGNSASASLFAIVARDRTRRQRSMLAHLTNPVQLVPLHSP